MLVVTLLVSLTASPTLVTTRVKGSIEASLMREVGGNGAALAAQVARLLRWRGDVIRNVQPNDSIRLLYEEIDRGQGVIPELVAIAYRGSEIQLFGYRFADVDGIPRYFDHSGALVEPWLRNSPTPYVQITEVVQRGRGKRRHKGIDLKADEGTVVYVPFAGRISRVNWSTRINGNCVEVIYDSGTYARFLHLSDVAATAIPGQRVLANTQIGTVGSTGRSSAAHLHYDLRDHADTILDPFAVHGTEVKRVSDGRRTQFDKQRTEFNRMLQISAESVSAMN
ncbi:MAG: hypothetical protein A2289_05275 [Deltaproteobacteria bacterium RIFOXYA12_FULL_58_15]|nr:MAG: hypothetical protein A2289_05275 [Deltaproteobacteria bacterium RIFOXYA12_FULL_58_15]OGR13098.1 MAG: hypothetical protein A2341_08460 [Deltaproteobacteria bacterium RIFOXYB12_FULL_58_9]